MVFESNRYQSKKRYVVYTIWLIFFPHRTRRSLLDLDTNWRHHDGRRLVLHLKRALQRQLSWSFCCLFTTRACPYTDNRLLRGLKHRYSSATGGSIFPAPWRLDIAQHPVCQAGNGKRHTRVECHLGYQASFRRESPRLYMWSLH